MEKEINDALDMISAIKVSADEICENGWLSDQQKLKELMWLINYHFETQDEISKWG